MTFKPHGGEFEEELEGVGVGSAGVRAGVALDAGAAH